MKNHILFITILLGAFTMAQGQESDRDKERRMNKEKVHALAVAYITEQLELTTDEAEKLWPVLNDLRDKKRALERKKRELMQEMDAKLPSLTDAQASEYINTITDLENQIFKSNYEYHSAQIIKIIGAKRFLKLMKAEMDFRKKMLREYKDRRGRGKEKP